MVGAAVSTYLRWISKGRRRKLLATVATDGWLILEMYVADPPYLQFTAYDPADGNPGITQYPLSRLPSAE